MSNKNLISINNIDGELTTLKKGDKILIPSFNVDEKLKIYGKDGVTLQIENDFNITQNISTFLINQTNHTFSFLTPIFYQKSTNSWVKAQANHIDTVATHLVLKIIDENNFLIAFSGNFTIPNHNLSIGEYYFTSETEPGVLTGIIPGHFNNVMLFVESENTINILGFRPVQVIDGGTFTGYMQILLNNVVVANDIKKFNFQGNLEIEKDLLVIDQVNIKFLSNTKHKKERFEITTIINEINLEEIPIIDSELIFINGILNDKDLHYQIDYQNKKITFNNQLQIDDYLIIKYEF
jgi:hypothetical protein